MFLREIFIFCTNALCIIILLNNVINLWFIIVLIIANRQSMLKMSNRIWVLMPEIRYRWIISFCFDLLYMQIVNNTTRRYRSFHFWILFDIQSSYHRRRRKLPVVTLCNFYDFYILYKGIDNLIYYTTVIKLRVCAYHNFFYQKEPSPQVPTFNILTISSRSIID